MTTPHNPCILLLVKYPLIGHIKTRLARDLDPFVVSELYKQFVTDLLTTLKKANLPFIIYYSPHQMRPNFLNWLGPDYDLLPQKGKNLGARLKHGIQTAFTLGFTSVIALASDVPDLSSNLLCTAAQALEQSDMVIGPCFDGGYYLIGFTQQSYHPIYLTNIPWSTSKVFTKTLTVAQQTQIQINILPPKQDIDTLADLQAFAHAIQNSPFLSSNTGSYIRRHFESLVS